MKKIIIIILCLFTLTGCYDYKELNDMNIVNCIGIDYENDEYIVYFETIKNKKSESSNEISTSIVSAKDEIFAEAVNKAINKAGKSAYLKHVKLLIIGENVAMNGISDIVDYLVRDISLSTAFFTIIADQPKELLKTKINDDSASNVIVDTIKSNMDADTLDNMDIIASNLYNELLDIAIPYVKLKDKNIEIENISYFKKDKMVGKIDNKIFNFIILQSQNIEFENDGNILSIYDKKVNFEISKNKITIKVEGLGKVKKANENINLSKQNDYKTIEDKINKTIENEINDFIKKTLDDGSDIIGFKNKYYKKYQKIINNIDYEVKSNIKISRNGAIYEVIHDK